jgi:succinate dehydrogenase / fumarate reductase iron-sulfur subunit
MRVTLQVWRQESAAAPGRFELHEVDGVTEDLSLFEVLDILNERLAVRGEPPIAFDSDCREGICGNCGIMIDGVAHGPSTGTASCEIYMREFRDGATILLEPWRARAFPIIRDLVVDRSALDRIISAGGFISVHAGSAPEANTILVPHDVIEDAMDAAACIACGACVAACPNGSASLFTASKITHLGLLPQGQPERMDRVLAMVRQMDADGFGGCTWHGECEAACPKRISIQTISRMHRDYVRAALTLPRETGEEQASDGVE